ncbi:MAG TPA: DUF6622 family protein [Cellvibrionaceae bacterium]
MLEILSHTPYWVFGLFIALVLLGLQQRKNRRVKMPLAFLLPLGMMVLSLIGVFSSFGLSFTPVVIWVVGLSLAASITARIFPVKGILYHAENNSFYIPGSAIPLLVIMAIFFTKYCVGVLHGMNPEALNSPTLKFLFALIYGLASGYFVGRSICLWTAFRTKAKTQHK